MLDIELVRRDPEGVKRGVEAKRGRVADVDGFLEADTAWRQATTTLERLRHEQNAASTTAASLTGREREEYLANLQRLARTVREAEERVAQAGERRRTRWEDLPNLPLPDVPEGPDASGNRVLRTVGEKPAFRFPPKEHWQLGATLDLLDNERAAKVSGSRFTYLKGDAVFLEFALIQYALSILTSREMLERILATARLDLPATPFTPVIPPVLITPDAYRKMARLEPRDDRYHIPVDDLYLVGSAEHTLGAMHADETFTEADLPRRYAGFSSAFRREAGSHGKDVHGIFRMHQFDKLELESFTVPEHGVAEQEFFVAVQEHLMQSLAIPYQVVLICTGDMSAPDARQVDIEAWFPGQNRYRETHTADYVTDYQARRLQTKVRRASGELVFAHMNDATAFAIGRTIAALLEVHQTADGTVRIPAVLRPFLGNREIIGWQPPDRR